MSLEASLCLSCCHIYLSNKTEFAAQAFYWIRQEYLDKGFETRLGLAFKDWLKSDWSFSKVDCPGRDL